jgi:hypothetical protein
MAIRTIRVPRVKPTKKPTPPKTAPGGRDALIEALRTMPDEAFGWVVIAIATRIFPDGLGGFMPDSRASIDAARAAAHGILEGTGA